MIQAFSDEKKKISPLDTDKRPGFLAFPTNRYTEYLKGNKSSSSVVDVANRYGSHNRGNFNFLYGFTFDGEDGIYDDFEMKKKENMSCDDVTSSPFQFNNQEIEQVTFTKERNTTTSINDDPLPMVKPLGASLILLMTFALI